MRRYLELFNFVFVAIALSRPAVVEIILVVVLKIQSNLLCCLDVVGLKNGKVLCAKNMLLSLRKQPKYQLGR
jgi:hypothetical protein